MQSIHRAPAWHRTAAVLLGNPDAPSRPGAGSLPGACTLIVYDPEGYQSFREECLRHGEDPEKDPTMQILHEPDRQAFLRLCAALAEIAPFLGLALITVETRNKVYENPIPDGLIPPATLAQVVWADSGVKAAFGIN